MFPSVTMVAILTVLSTLAAARRPARCVGGGDQLTVCVETPIQPRRYDNGGLYGAEYWRRKYGGGRGYGHTATRYDYRVQTKPLADTRVPALLDPIPIDYGFEGRTGYGAPSGHDGHVEYAGRARYAGGFRPVVVEQRTYHDEHHSQPRGARPAVRPPAARDRTSDVVWQKVGRPAYMNNPMTSVSGYPNLLNCPNTYVSSTPTNYGFNIAGPKTTLVIKNATAADYGVYRCYATKVSRQTPRQRTPVYMEVYYGPSGTSGRH
ncbi:hypothetical protein FJT64_027567 [Amphibalanus amphitrite]|uniref:Ig-like domain-containing protein n=1 Tax=Amphibalanus amphitrite TaxID=1232801 RepID=A0A6A4WA38_AMPAM|nr:hypothetical protein FJT64_027567 [Amphibalanus amphitrite]